VQVGLGTQGQVNVLFVPSNADAAQALQSALPNLGNAMAQSGLTLGQAQVGGQFSQQQGQGGQGGYTPARQGNSNGSATDSQPTITGLSAYA
jgi:flagellar hook-length control protein FliK